MVANPLTVVQMLPELDAGGVEQETLEMGRYLSKKGHFSIVISQGGKIVSQLEQEGSAHIKWKRIGEKSPMCLQYIIPLRRFLIQKKVDILHLRSRVPAWIGYLAWKSLPKNNRPKLVTTCHGFYSVNKISEIMTKGERVTVVSKAIAEHIHDKYNIKRNKIDIIYSGVDQEFFNPDSISTKRIESVKNSWNIKKLTTPIIVLPARLTKLKGHDVFIKSLSMIRDLSWTAICIGDINEKSSHTKKIRKMIVELNLQNRVALVKHCIDLPAAFMLADIVVSASTKPEAFGKIAVEAQCMGKLVIASAHGGSLETVIDKKTGWLVKPCSSNELSKALKNAILNKDLRNKIGKNSMKWAKDNFSSQKMCDETLALYYKLCKKKRDAACSVFTQIQ